MLGNDRKELKRRKRKAFKRICSINQFLNKIINFFIMKSISKLKLTQLSKTELVTRELNTLKGGYCICDDGCSCSCNPQDLHTSNYNWTYSGQKGTDQVSVGGSNLGYDGEIY
jgi:natural product precursor